jgi:hypothetical protein
MLRDAERQLELSTAALNAHQADPITTSFKEHRETGIQLRVQIARFENIRDSMRAIVTSYDKAVAA